MPLIMTQRAVHLGLLLAATLAGHAVAQFTTFTNLTACDLGASAPAISAQPACRWELLRGSQGYSSWQHLPSLCMRPFAGCLTRYPFICLQ